MHKSINTNKLNFSEVRRIVIKYVLKSYVFYIGLIITLVFFWFKYLTLSMFSNDYILNSFIVTRGYSSKCLILKEKEGVLINQLYDFYQNPKNIDGVIPIFFNNMPKNFEKVNNLNERKAVFINILLPVVIKAKETIINDRNRLEEIRLRLQETPLLEEDYVFIGDLARKYNVKIYGDNFWDYAKAMEELLVTVDVIPTSLILAVAIKETNWGASLLLKKGNILFPQVWLAESGTETKVRLERARYDIKDFDSIEDAVKAYYGSINMNDIYTEFRKLRARTRPSGEELNPIALARKLPKFSHSTTYIEELVQIIKSNRLQQYDNYEDFLDNYNTTCVKII